MKKETINILDKKFETYLTIEEIHKSIQKIADKINTELKGEDVIFMGILNGAFMFASDLFQRINIPAQITFLKLASYEGTVSTGNVKRLIGINEDIKNKTVVVLEDIIDTGITMESIIKQLSGYEPKAIKIATLLFKPNSFQKDYPIDYIGFDIPDDFIVGYGLDYDGFGRNYSDIYSIIENKEEPNKMTNIIIFGPPGSGKSTQAKILIKKHNMVHLSTGDILRTEISANTILGQEAGSFMNHGNLVPDEIVIKMIEKKLENNKGCNGFIFDGFPRTAAQAKALDELFEKYNTETSVMIGLDVNNNTLKERLLARGKVEGRPDDTAEIIETRIKVFSKQTAKVAEYYKEQNKFTQINGVGTIDEVFERLEKELNRVTTV